MQITARFFVKILQKNVPIIEQFENIVEKIIHAIFFIDWLLHFKKNFGKFIIFIMKDNFFKEF